MLCLQDYDRPGLCLPQHTWFMLLTVIASAAVFGLVCKRAIFGALFGAVVGIVFPTIFLHQYNVGYSYWEARPQSECQAQEIVGPTLNGDAFDIKNCKGKLLLVDYWATWCKPCVAGIPHVLEAWDKFHNQGLDIVGISLDTTRQSLKDFVDMHEVAYPQIFFEEKGKSGYDNPLAAKYGVSAIPQLVLIEPQSQMILTSITNGRDLQWTVKAALDALNRSPLSTLDVAHHRLATVSLLPYICGLSGALIGILFELFVWRCLPGNLSARRPKLTRVK